jgi:hypothetical protein
MDTTNSEALRAWRDRTLYRMLIRAARAETTETLRRLQARGYRDISLQDTNLLANLDTAVSQSHSRPLPTHSAFAPFPSISSPSWP